MNIDYSELTRVFFGVAYIAHRGVKWLDFDFEALERRWALSQGGNPQAD